MLVRKPTSKKRTTAGTTTVDPLNSSLTSIEWLPNMQIGKNSLTSSSTTPIEQQQQQQLPRSSSESTLPLPLPMTLPVSLSANVQHKLEATDMDTTPAGLGATGNAYLKPPFSYVTLIRRAILSANTQRMTLNEIYQWIVDSYPYFRTAPPKWKNSIRHNLSLNKCFKRLQRSTNDPGKGSYWALDESCESGSPSTNRKRRIDEPQLPIHLLPSSPTGTTHHPPYFYTNNNPMFCDVNSSGGQSSSPDDSNSNMALTPNTNWLPLGDMNIELTASFRRFREQVLDNSSTTSVVVSDIPSTSTVGTAAWGHELFPNGETNGFLESIKLASSGEINWNDIDVKPYCEFLDGFRTSSTFPQQDREKLINLASSLSSFFDYTGITNLAQSRAAHEMTILNRLPIISAGPTAGTTINHTSSLPVVIEEDVGSFDWDSIT